MWITTRTADCEGFSQGRAKDAWRRAACRAAEHAHVQGGEGSPHLGRGLLTQLDGPLGPHSAQHPARQGRPEQGSNGGRWDV